MNHVHCCRRCRKQHTGHEENRRSYGQLRFQALGHAMALAHETNRFLDYRAPWKQVREDKNGASNTLVSALYSIACLKVVLYPFLPFTSQKLHELLGFSGNIEDHGWEIRPPSPGLDLPKPEPLFVKLDDKIASEMVAKLGSYAD